MRWRSEGGPCRAAKKVKKQIHITGYVCTEDRKKSDDPGELAVMPKICAFRQFSAISERIFFQANLAVE